MEIAGYTAPDKYVSTRCWLGEHEECRRHPIVRCACVCHEVDALDLDPEPCLECGEPGVRPLVPSRRMVSAGDGHWKPAPPVPLCDRHHQAIADGDLPLPAWCAVCDAWRVTPHQH
jgi:hypothetical protein